MEDREFGIVKNAKTLTNNYERLMQDTVAKTRNGYHKRFKQWTKTVDGYYNFKQKLLDVDKKWLNGDYRHATVRQYKATAVYALSTLYQLKQDASIVLKDDYETYEALSKVLTFSQLDDLYYVARKLGEEGVRKELDFKAHLNAKTSSIKDKRFDPKLMQAVIDYCGDTERYWLLKTFLKLNTKIGLRPVEYEGATLMTLKYFDDHQSVREYFGVTSTNSTNDLDVNTSVDSNEKGLGAKCLLVVKNGKNSHGRACGDYRFLVLNVFDDSEYALFTKMLLLLNKKKAESKDFDADIMYPLQDQLKYILDKDKTCQKIINSLYSRRLRTYKYDVKTNGNRKRPIKKHPTLYSTRHQAVANAKKEGVHPVIIASAFGHASILTAEEHYGVRWHGSGKAVTPHQYSVNSVVDRLTTNQKAKLVSLQAQDTKQAQPSNQGQVSPSQVKRSSLTFGN